MASEKETQKTARVTEVQPDKVRKQPKPGSKKEIVFKAGRTKAGGSIKATAEALGGTTLSNVRQHITQCKTVHGYGYKIQGDKYWILGETTVTWDQQQAGKEEKKGSNKKEKKEEKEETGEDKGESAEDDEDLDLDDQD